MKNNFRTIIDLKKSELDITYSDKLMLAGSCFSNNIGEKLNLHKFDVNINPFGIVFNPISLVQQLRLLNSATEINDNFIFQHNELWHSWLHHSSFSANSKQELLQNINSKFQEAKNFLQEADFLIITLGTAFAYELKEKKLIVSNCHQVPNHQFEKKLLEYETIVAELDNFLSLLKEKNPKLKVIFTLSPVRHWKDGVVENQRSKAILTLAIHQLCDKFTWVNYFPAYEIMMDDLRDYRFYKADMLHPNQQAVNYIWEQFKVAYFDNKTSGLLSKMEQVNRNKQHRSRFPESEQHLAFLAKTTAEEKILLAEINAQKNRKS